MGWWCLERWALALMGGSRWPCTQNAGCRDPPLPLRLFVCFLCCCECCHSLRWIECGVLRGALSGVARGRWGHAERAGGRAFGPVSLRSDLWLEKTNLLDLALIKLLLLHLFGWLSSGGGCSDSTREQSKLSKAATVEDERGGSRVRTLSVTLSSAAACSRP